MGCTDTLPPSSVCSQADALVDGDAIAALLGEAADDRPAERDAELRRHEAARGEEEHDRAARAGAPSTAPTASNTGFPILKDPAPHPHPQPVYPPEHRTSPEKLHGTTLRENGTWAVVCEASCHHVWWPAASSHLSTWVVGGTARGPAWHSGDSAQRVTMRHTAPARTSLGSMNPAASVHARRRCLRGRELCRTQGAYLPLSAAP